MKFWSHADPFRAGINGPLSHLTDDHILLGGKPPNEYILKFLLIELEFPCRCERPMQHLKRLTME